MSSYTKHSVKSLISSDSEKQNVECVICTTKRSRETRNLRLMFLAIILLFAFSSALLFWIVQLSFELTKLQGHVKHLTKFTEDTSRMKTEHSRSKVTNEHRGLDSFNASEEFSNLQPILSINQLMLDSLNEEDGASDGKEIDLSDVKDHQFSSDERKRVDRSIDFNENPDVLRPSEPSLLKRTKRGRRSRKDSKGRGRITKNKAVAFHVRVQDTGGPYAGNSLDGHFINSWETNPSVGFGFDFSQINNGPTGGVKIKVPGVYYIYSQVSFKMGAGLEANHKITTGLFGNLNLSACTGSFPRDHSSDDYITCHASGIVRLAKYHLIRLHISPRNLEVFMSPQHTYFGAFLIGK